MFDGQSIATSGTPEDTSAGGDHDVLPLVASPVPSTAVQSVLDVQLIALTPAAPPLTSRTGEPKP